MKSTILSLILTVIHHFAIGQQDPKPFRCWLSPGLSLGFSGEFNVLPGAKVALEASSFEKVFYSLHYRNAVNLEGIDGGEFKSNSIVDMSEYAAMVGVGRYVSSHLCLAAMSGINYSYGTFRGEPTGQKSPGWPVFGASNADEEFEYHSFKEIGVPVHGRLMLTGSHLGFSVDLFYNIQEHASYGINLSLLAGWIR